MDACDNATVSKMPCEHSNNARFPLRICLFLKKLMHISPLNFPIFSMKVGIYFSEKSEEKNRWIYSKMCDLSDEIWQGLRARTALFLRMAENGGGPHDIFNTN